MNDQKTIPAARTALPTRSESSSKELFKALLTPAEAAKLYRGCITPLACANSEAYSLSGMRKIYGECEVVFMLAAWIIDIQRFLNISAKMDSGQINETARMILDDFWALNSADVNLVMSRAKRGFYGQLFGRIDGQIIYQWFSQYFDERCEACSGREIHESKVHESEISRIDPETKAKILQCWQRQHEPRRENTPVCDS